MLKLSDRPIPRQAEGKTLTAMAQQGAGRFGLSGLPEWACGWMAVLGARALRSLGALRSPCFKPSDRKTGADGGVTGIFQKSYRQGDRQPRSL
jgi:hypothetical protein